MRLTYPHYLILETLAHHTVHHIHSLEHFGHHIARGWALRDHGYLEWVPEAPFNLLRLTLRGRDELEAWRRMAREDA